MVTYNCRCLFDLLIVRFVVWTKVFSVIHFDKLSSRPYATKDHPDIGIELEQKPDNFFANTIFEWSISKIMPNRQNLASQDQYHALNMNEDKTEWHRQQTKRIEFQS